MRDLKKKNKRLQARVEKIKDEELQEGTINSLQASLEKSAKDLEALRGELDLSQVENSKLQEKDAQRELLVGKIDSQVRGLEAELNQSRDELLTVKGKLERYTSGDEVVQTKNTLRDYLLIVGGREWLSKFLEKDGEDILYSCLA